MTGSRNFLLALMAVVIAPFVLLLLPGGVPDAPSASAAFAPPPPSSSAATAISAEDAAGHRGDFATVEGFVRNVHIARNGSATFIDLDDVYPDNPFSAIIFADDMEHVGAVSDLVGRTVDITGEIRIYRGRPEIIVSSRKQIAAR